MFRSFYLWFLFDITIDQRDQQQKFIDNVNERLSHMPTIDERLAFIQETFGEIVYSTNRDAMLCKRRNDWNTIRRVFSERLRHHLRLERPSTDVIF